MCVYIYICMYIHMDPLLFFIEVENVASCICTFLAAAGGLRKACASLRTQGSCYEHHRRQRFGVHPKAPM